MGETFTVWDNIAVKALLAGAVGYTVYSLVKGLQQVTARDHSYNASAFKTRLYREVDTNVVACQPYFLNKDKLYIFWRVWDIPAGVPCKGVVVISHGLNEHSGRYHHVAKALTSMGLKVYALDHQGHGVSEGDRMFVKDFNDYVVDVLALLKKAQLENKGKKIFILGHSLGGLIAILTTLKAKEEGLKIDAAIFSAPALWLNPKKTPAALIAVLSFVASIFPKARLMPFELDTLVRDNNVLDLYRNDSLRYPGAATLHLQSQIVKYQRIANNAASSLDIPVLLIHGGKDGLVEKPGTDIFFSKLTTKDKEYKAYDDEFHELFNCPDYRTGALADVQSGSKNVCEA